MANEMTIPCLPCGSIKDMLDFYTALGFEITYQQERPNSYAVVKYEDAELHFFAMKGIDPANSYTTCLVLIDDADSLYKVFAANLRQRYGKLPSAGIPRITKPNNKNAAGDWRFNVIDPGGNYIRFIQRGGKVDVKDPNAVKTPLSQAIGAAEFLVIGKGEFAPAAALLDNALAKDLSASTTQHRVQALILRAEIALNMEDSALAQKLVAEIRQLPLTDEERAALHDELQRTDDLL